MTVPPSQKSSSWASCAPDELAFGGGTTTNNPGSNQVNPPDVDFGTRSGSTGPADAPNQWFYSLFNPGPNRRVNLMTRIDVTSSGITLP